MKIEIENIFRETEEEKLRFNPKEISILDPWTKVGVISTLHDKSELYLEKPELVKTISCPENQEWGLPFNISSVDDDCILISDWSKYFITMAYSLDKPTVIIPAQYGRVRDACLFKDSLYAAYDNFITKRTFYNGPA